MKLGDEDGPNGADWIEYWDIVRKGTDPDTLSELEKEPEELGVYSIGKDPGSATYNDLHTRNAESITSEKAQRLARTRGRTTYHLF